MRMKKQMKSSRGVLLCVFQKQGGVESSETRTISLMYPPVGDTHTSCSREPVQTLVNSFILFYTDEEEKPSRLLKETTDWASC